ncbi:MAG TPA: HAMP domain-containing sensor histidine kinase [Tepidiformaceae bacterium]|nr:HAMP domain-containing sensor histidine kinase [Tepidiformaceae bacterium]
MSLRARLIVGLVVVVLAGLAGANVTTYVVVRGFLLDRIDDQLVQAADPISREIDRQRNTTPYPDGTYPYPQREGSRDRGIPPTSFPPGTYGEIRNADGTSSSLVLGFGTSYAPPKLPEELDISEATFLSVDATDGSFRYRVLARTISDGRVLFTAVPMTSVDQTMSDLRTTSLGVSAAVVLVVAALALWLVRLGLRPLDSMAVTAGEIAAGNLTRRVEHTDNRTEVGRLGTALNQMLASLEEAFAEQKASEEQLRRLVADATHELFTPLSSHPGDAALFAWTSHDLRTPLTSIRGYAELFRRGADQRPEDLAKVMRRVDEESARMSVLVEELLLLARLNQGRPLDRAPVDIAQLAQDAVDDAQVVAPGRRIELVAPEPVYVHGDEARLRQVVANLVTNALNHTPADAAVTVTVREDGAKAVLEVADLGPGLSPEDAPHVFEPFYRVDKGRVRSKGGGTGLGLAIVKAIVEAHAGSVATRPNTPHGAVFSVALPV